jgi:hypothetical protein
MLKTLGFGVKKILITGHHPERFPLIGALLKTGTPGYAFFHNISRIFGWGDTFEVYAVKAGDDHGA